MSVLYAQLDTQRMTKCPSERSIGDLPVPDRCPVMSKPAVEPLSPHIHTKGPIKVGYRSWQEFLEQRKPERTFLDTPFASSAPSGWQRRIRCQREHVHRGVRRQIAGRHQARAIDLRNRTLAFVGGQEGHEACEVLCRDREVGAHVEHAERR